MAIDYFTKWVEAISLVAIIMNNTARFIRRDIICRYGVPNKIITDNATNFVGKDLKLLCKKFKIHHYISSPYIPQMNGVVEVANKNLKKILQKMTTNHSNWHKMLPNALMAYRTSIRTSTGVTPYSLVYGMEAVLPIEVEIPSLRVLAEAEILESTWAQVRHDQLNLIDEKRL